MSSKKNNKNHPWRKPFSDKELRKQAIEGTLEVVESVEDLGDILIMSDQTVINGFTQTYDTTASEEA
jgi:hypothetical protein